jgi:hypothetical protein
MHCSVGWNSQVLLLNPRVAPSLTAYRLPARNGSPLLTKRMVVRILFGDLNRPIRGGGGEVAGVARIRYSFQLRFERRRRLPSGYDLSQVTAPGRASPGTIVFISFSEAQSKRQADWAEASAGVIIRRCPVCSRDSVRGHGRRRKQAHDEHHDWIEIRRGFCRPCGTTITFLPAFSLPYSHYSLIARSEALRRYFVEGCSWEAAAPPVKDPNRVADSSTVRRWFQALDSSRPAFSCLRRTVQAIDRWIRGGQVLRHHDLQLSWSTVCPLLHRFWPLRI